MSYKSTVRPASKQDDAPISYACPARGCHNAASTSFDGSRWACYAHAKAPANEWPQVTQELMEKWPASCNWNHPDKVAYEQGESAKRRATRTVVGPTMSDSGALAPWLTEGEP